MAEASPVVEVLKLADQLECHPASRSIAEIEQAGRMLRALAHEVHVLRRWRSTHAPRLEALQGLLEVAQREAAAGTEARATLASERAANAMLTDKVQQLERAP